MINGIATIYPTLLFFTVLYRLSHGTVSFCTMASRGSVSEKLVIYVLTAVGVLGQSIILDYTIRAHIEPSI